jgi:hypothetical protein
MLLIFARQKQYKMRTYQDICTQINEELDATLEATHVGKEPLIPGRQLIPQLLLRLDSASVVATLRAFFFCQHQRKIIPAPCVCARGLFHHLTHKEINPLHLPRR